MCAIIAVIFQKSHFTAWIFQDKVNLGILNGKKNKEPSKKATEYDTDVLTNKFDVLNIDGGFKLFK